MSSTHPSSRESSDNFRADVLKQVRTSDIVLMAMVPIALTVVYLLPTSIQRSLVLDYGNPSIVQLWTGAYVHRGFGHFSNNLLSYCILIGPSYLLFVLAGERRLFRSVFISFLLVLPPVFGVINIVVIGQGTGAGFSGIVAAFAGLVPAALFVFTNNRVSCEVGPSDGVAVFLLALGGILGIRVPAGVKVRPAVGLPFCPPYPSLRLRPTDGYGNRSMAPSCWYQATTGRGGNHDNRRRTRPRQNCKSRPRSAIAS